MEKVLPAVVAAIAAFVAALLTPRPDLDLDSDPIRLDPQAAQAGAMVYAIYCEPSEDDEVSSGCAPYRDPFPKPGKDQPSLPDWITGLRW